MGYTLRLLEVNFDELLRIPGSHDEELLDRLLPQLEELSDPEFADDGDDAGLTPAEALRQIVNGEVPSDESRGEPYHAALAALYLDLATSGDEIPMASHELGHIQAVEEALGAAGAKAPLSVMDLVYRGAPVRVPQGEDFPCLGYLTPDEVAAAYQKFSALRLSGVPEGTLETIRKLGAVLEEAARQKLGLVSVLE